MKYLKLVNSFDEFAEQAAAGTVFYHIQESVYYWLNLKSIWGYIGYNPSTSSFITNGKQFSVIPSVPDPESLNSPVKITGGSFPTGYRPTLLTFKHSDFSSLPIVDFYGFGSSTQRVKFVVECENIPIPNILYVSGYYMDIVLKEAGLFDIKYIGLLSGRSVSSVTIVIDDSNTSLLDINCYAHPPFQRGGFMWKCERNVELLTENDIFENVPAILSGDNYLVWYNLGQAYRVPSRYPTIVDCSNYNNIKISLHSLNELSVPAFYPYGIPNLANIIIDAKNSEGKIDDDLYEGWLSATSNKLFSTIQYENVSDFGTYYKPYLQTNEAQLVPLDILGLCRNKYIEIFSNNVINTALFSWTLVAAQSIDLSGIKHFVYYNGVKLYYSATITEEISSYSQFVENGITSCKKSVYYFTVVSTPKLSNVNLESFGSFPLSLYQNNLTWIYFNTDDLSVNLGTLKVAGPEAHIYIADKDIYINDIDGAGLYILEADTLGQGIVHLKHFPTNNPDRTVYISVLSYVGSQRRHNLLDVSELVNVNNPTALDYYNTGITMSVSVYNYDATNGFITRAKMSASRVEDLHNVSSAKLKCVAGGGEFYDNSYLIATTEDMENLFNAIPNREVSSLTLSFNESQFALLTQEQIDYATGLGYSVVKHIA